MDEPEVLVSIDGEFTGPIPGPYSMISMGAVAYDSTGKELSRFKVNLEELSGSVRHHKTMEWWLKFPEAWETATKNPVHPSQGMLYFAFWLKSLPGKPKVMGWPLPADFLFIYWYYVYFRGTTPPFKFDGIDIKTYAMAKLGIPSLKATSMEAVQRILGIPKKELSHDPVDDAVQQAEIFFALRRL